jgi:hypothetical protein
MAPRPLVIRNFSTSQCSLRANLDSGVMRLTRNRLRLAWCARFCFQPVEPASKRQLNALKCRWADTSIRRSLSFRRVAL